MRKSSESAASMPRTTPLPKDALVRERLVAVIGAGNMGSGIAQKYASEGFDVLLLDLDEAALARGRRRIDETLQEAVARKLYSEAKAAEIGARIVPTLDWERLAEASLVIEAVFEDLDVKRAVFSRVDSLTGPATLLATNTSSFLIRDLVSGLHHPDRVLGLHYFYHPAKNRLVEVIPGPTTSLEALRVVADLQEQIGKTPIASADSPGFIVNRFFVPWINEAARMLDEEIAGAATIEQAAREGFGIPMGPFELMNVTGVAIGYHAAESLARALGPFYAPAAGLEERAQSNERFAVEGEPDRSRFLQVVERLDGVAFLVAATLVEEEVGTPEDTDIGARVGLRWPRGPFERMAEVGPREALRRAEAIASRWTMPVPSLLQEAAKTRVAIPVRRVDLRAEDEVAWITIRRPDAMNALDEAVVAELSERIEEAFADRDVRGIVLGGSGKAFVAGADIRFFVRAIEEKRFDRIRAFTEQGQSLLARIEDGPKPVVARLHGLAIGGGAELALACDRIVASPKAYLSFPETGIGIYPGLGGTVRLPRRIGLPLARWLILTGTTVDATLAEAIGLVDAVVPFGELREALLAALDQGKADKAARSHVALAPAAGETDAFADSRARTAGCFFSGPADVDALLAPRAGSPPGAAASSAGKDEAKIIETLRRKAPIALRIADQLLLGNAMRSRDDGLRAELDRLEEVFATRDAYEGLTSLGVRKPVYEGR
ncbi:MAG: 3-hydroxyacyl-CoA dehydrogenase/enoyl-CoA hydratase family protein [Candidatus Eisenbacteria bacterium]